MILLNLNGEGMRAQLGKNYFLLPTHDAFECSWHRRGLTQEQMMPPPQFNRSGMKVPFVGYHAVVPCEARSIWYLHEVREDALKDLPSSELPDGRLVVGVPKVPAFGAVLRGEWATVVQAAQRARGPIMKHAYIVALERLQRWKLVGKQVLDALAAQDAQIQAGQPTDMAALTVEPADRELVDWIFVFARSLNPRAADSEIERAAFEQALATFRPFSAAYEALALSTGYTTSAVETMIRREQEGGGPARGSKPSSSAE